MNEWYENKEWIVSHVGWNADSEVRRWIGMSAADKEGWQALVERKDRYWELHRIAAGNRKCGKTCTSKSMTKNHGRR